LLRQVRLSVSNLTERLGALHGSMDTINERLVQVEAASGVSGGDAGAAGFSSQGVGHDDLDLDM